MKFNWIITFNLRLLSICVNQFSRPILTWIHLLQLTTTMSSNLSDLERRLNRLNGTSDEASLQHRLNQLQPETLTSHTHQSLTARFASIFGSSDLPVSTSSNNDEVEAYLTAAAQGDWSDEDDDSSGNNTQLNMAQQAFMGSGGGEDADAVSALLSEAQDAIRMSASVAHHTTNMIPDDENDDDEDAAVLAIINASKDELLLASKFGVTDDAADHKKTHKKKKRNDSSSSESSDSESSETSSDDDSSDYSSDEERRRKKRKRKKNKKKKKIRVVSVLSKRIFISFLVFFENVRSFSSTTQSTHYYVMSFWQVFTSCYSTSSIPYQSFNMI